jgi:ribosomal protein S19E (S16A)
MSEDVQGDHQFLPQSLQPLAEIAASRAGAEGYAIYEVDPATGVRELRLACGAPVPDSDVAGLKVDSFALQISDDVRGILAFVFRGRSITPAGRKMLERIAGAMESVWRLTLLPGAYARSAARIGELEIHLVDSKIRDRACGMLAGILANPGSDLDVIDTIVRHVESVLRPGQLRTVLTQLTSEVEQEIAERALTSRAKAALQRRYGMSEDQAHVHLRLLSRKGRRRLTDVARQVLEETA